MTKSPTNLSKACSNFFELLKDVVEFRGFTPVWHEVKFVGSARGVNSKR